MHSECKEEKTFCLFKLFATEAQRHRVNEVLMLDMFESHDDVQSVNSNFELSPDLDMG